MSPIYKGGGCLSEILKRTPKRYQGPVLWVWLEFVSFLRGINSKTTYSESSAFFFWLSPIKGTAKDPAVELLRVNTLRATKTAFLTSKRYDKHTIFLYRSPPPLPPGVKQTSLIPSHDYYTSNAHVLEPSPICCALVQDTSLFQCL